MSPGGKELSSRHYRQIDEGVTGILLNIAEGNGRYAEWAHLDTATNGDIQWRSAGLRPGVSGSGSRKGAGPEAGAPVAVSRCADAELDHRRFLDIAEGSAVKVAADLDLAVQKP